MSEQMNCIRWGELLVDIYISDVGGISHPKCYYLAHPFVRKTTVVEVLASVDDCVLARNLVVKCVTPSDARAIVKEFNFIMQEQWRRRVA